MYLLTSSDRNYGGTVIHGIFSTAEKAWEASENIEDIDYWRIPSVKEMKVDVFLKDEWSLSSGSPMLPEGENDV